MKFVKRNIWDWLEWMALGMILLWAIAKAFGLINTPQLVELAPIFGAVYIAGRQVQKLEMVTEDLNDVKRDVHDLNIKIHDLDKRMGNVELRLTTVEARAS